MKHPFAQLIGLVFESMEEGKSLCRIEVNENLFNPQNVVHGGVLYSMADTGMGGALYPLLKDDEYCATIEIKITYFKAVRKGILQCMTTLLNKGKNVASLESVITNNKVEVAKASGSYAIFKPND